MCSFPERAVRIQALVGDIVLCSWARHLTLTVPLSILEYKWVAAICWGNLTNCGEVTCDGLASHPFCFKAYKDLLKNLIGIQMSLGVLCVHFNIIIDQMCCIAARYCLGYCDLLQLEPLTLQLG